MKAKQLVRPAPVAADHTNEALLRVKHSCSRAAVVLLTTLDRVSGGVADATQKAT
ncbi:hypothetical protein JXB37_03420 [candidate division WOR-3 bacterium]|nr:hypothetical protein [candidate division WOR-3 bacterium]